MDAAPPATLPDRWGYPIHTTSAPCIAAIDAYYDQFLAYGRKRSIILDAVLHDPACVLANALAAHFLSSSNPDKAAALLAAAFAASFFATAYERAVLVAVSCLVRGGEENATLDRHFETTWNMEWLLDLQGLWALSSCSETKKAEDLLKSMKSRFESMSEEKQHRMQSVIPLTEAMYEYGRRNYQKVFDILGPDFDAINYRMIGASGEQLDVFNEFWYDVLLCTGHTSQAIDLLQKQVTIREGIPFLWRLLEKAYLMEGRIDDAYYAGEKAKALEGAYF